MKGNTKEMPLMTKSERKSRDIAISSSEDDSVYTHSINNKLASGLTTRTVYQQAVMPVNQEQKEFFMLGVCCVKPAH